MNPAHLAASVFLSALLAACGDATPPEGPMPATTGSSAHPDPAAILAALPPEAQPYGLDVYTVRCAGCHGELGQGIDKAPTLRKLSRAELFQKVTDCRAARLAGDPAAVMPVAVAALSDAELAAASIYAGE